LFEKDKGRKDKPFRKLAQNLDSGRRPSKAVAKQIGAVQGKLVAWLRETQQPFVQIYNEWEGTGEGRFRGQANLVSACRVKKSVTRIGATIDAESGDTWSAGLLLHFTDADDFTVALVTSTGTLKIHRRQAGAWEIIHQDALAMPSKEGQIKLAAVREANGVRVTVGSETFGPFELPGNTFGLALDNCTARFRNVSWE
jgi:hypothetical protein